MYTGREGSIAVIVSPLTSLMMDQKLKFTPTGIRVEFVGEAQENEAVTQAVLNGEIHLVYISPECLFSKRYWRMFQSMKYQEKMIAFVVDEAHCVKMWLACKCCVLTQSHSIITGVMILEKIL